jgi:cobalt-zinc-cadmium efflux system membrane fusion protein
MNTTEFMKSLRMKKSTNHISTNGNFIKGLSLSVLIAMASCSAPTEKVDVQEDVAAVPTEESFVLTKNQFNSNAMQLGSLEMQPFNEMVKCNGKFDVPPKNRATVSCYFGGSVKNIELLPGEFVKKGQVLFTLENPEYVEIQQAYLVAQGELAYVKADFERQKELIKNNVTSQKKYLKAESDYTVTQVNMESLRKKLILMNIDPNTLSIDNLQTTIKIYSPINGFVTDVAIARGSFLNPSETALSIVDTDHLHLELNIFEKDLSKVKIGQAIDFKIQGNTTETFKATVHLINKTVNEGSRSIGIHGHLEDETTAHGFAPGMYVEASIFTRSHSKSALPKDALVAVDNNYFALVLVDSTDVGYTFKKVPMTVGETHQNEVEILNAQDFAATTKFLVQGAFNLIQE